MKYIKSVALLAILLSSVSLISGTAIFGQLAIPSERTLAIIGSDGLLFGLSEVETDGKNLSVEIATPFAPMKAKNLKHGLWMINVVVLHIISIWVRLTKTVH